MMRVVGLLAAGVVSLGLLVSLYDAVFRPALRRLAARNLRRRGGEALLVVVGSALGTATIVASLLVGATFHASVRDGARTRLGPVDEQVSVRDVNRLDEVLAAVTKAPALADTDGVLRVVTGSAALTAGARPGSASRARPDAHLAEVDVAAARTFGGDPAATGLAALRADPASDQIVVNRPTADDLHVGVGDSISLHAYGTTRKLRVSAVLSEVGLAGYADAFVATGTLEALAAASTAPSARPPAGEVLVSNQGGVFGGASVSREVSAALRQRLVGIPGTDVTMVKADLLRDANEQGQAMGQLFVGVGTFSVLAGVLLLVNLVVMLAEERRRELGLARAVGLRRSQVSRLFALEGTIYAAGAAVLGGALGTGVGWLIVAATRRVLGTEDVFHLRFAAPVGVVVIGAAVGFGVAVVTVWAASFRIANLTVVRALRDVPEPPRAGHRLHTSGLGAAASLGGVAVGVWGAVLGNPLSALVGPPLALAGLLPLLRPVFGRRLTVGSLAGVALVWCAGVFAFLPDLGDGVPVGVFVVQGVLLVAAAVAFATAIDHFWVTLVDRLSRAGRGLSARLGLAYPLARLARTAMLLATYALVVFTLSFLAIYGQIFGRQAGQFTDDVRAGSDLLVDANPANPVASAQLRDQPDVVGLAALWRAAPEFTTTYGHAATTWPLTGFDAQLLAEGTPALSERAPGFPSDAAVFRALLADPGLIVVDEQFLATSAQNEPGSAKARIGDEVLAQDPVTGERQRFRVVGLLAHDTVQAGAFVSAPSARALMGSLAVQSRFYVRVAPGTDPQRVADRLEATFVDRGVDARTFRSVVDRSIATQLGFFRLMGGYLLLGLVIGTAGIGVVMVRAVRERRRQIGMLRAMGFSRDTVRRAFAVEAAFIALQGTVMGIGLGLVISWQMLTRSAALGGDPLPYSVPWGTLAVLAVLPLATSLVAVLIPAAQAARVNPAVALYRSD